MNGGYTHSPKVATAFGRAAYRLALIAGCTFALASGLTNLIYALGKTQDPAQQALWASVALAASITLTLSPSAFVAACRSRSIAGAVFAVLAFVLCGAYSLSGALGSAVGIRLNAESVATDTDGKRARTQKSYDDASTELAALAPSRPEGELQQAITGIVASDGRLKEGDCGARWLESKKLRTKCIEVRQLQAELAVARKRTELSARIEAASRELSDLGAPKPVNTDAVALSAYLGMAGVDVAASDLNRWLALLAVALVEFGGGLAFAVAGVFQHVARGEGSASLAGSTLPQAPGHVEQAPRASITSTPNPTELASGSTPGTAIPVKLTVADDASCRLVELVRSHGNQLLGSHRTFGKALGVSHTQAGRVLDELEASGRVTVTRGKSGTVVRLAA